MEVATNTRNKLVLSLLFFFLCIGYQDAARIKQPAIVLDILAILLGGGGRESDQRLRSYLNITPR